MNNSIKQQLTADPKQVKTQSGDRIQRIKAIFKTAFSDAVAEVKDGLKQDFPQRWAQVKGKTVAWDEQLSDRYGDDYTGIKQRFSQAFTWYKAKLEEGKAINAQPLERQPTQKAETLSDLGVKVAQKEETVKQKIGQTLRTITVNSQS